MLNNLTLFSVTDSMLNNVLQDKVLSAQYGRHKYTIIDDITSKHMSIVLSFADYP